MAVDCRQCRAGSRRQAGRLSRAHRQAHAGTYADCSLSSRDSYKPHLAAPRRCWTRLCIKSGVRPWAMRGLGQVPPKGAAHAAGGGLVEDGRVGLPARQVGSKDVVAAPVLENCWALCAVPRLQAGT
jgi:hypothetical protein